MQENKEKLQELYASDEKPDLIGHVEKDPDRPSTTLRDLRSGTEQPKSLFAMETADRIMMVLDEQEKRSKLEEKLQMAAQARETDKGDAQGKETSDVDLEAAMDKATGEVATTTTEDQETNLRDPADKQPAGEEQQVGGEGDNQQTSKDNNQRDLARQTGEKETTDTDYAKEYKTGAKDRSDRGAARKEKQVREEEKKRRQEEKEAAERQKEQKTWDKDNQVIEKALLEEEEKEAKRRLALACRIRKDKRKKKTDEEWKRKKLKVEDDDIEEEEVDDVDADPDYNPDMDFPEDDESMIIEGEEDADIIEIDKHTHCVNFADAGQFTIWIREQLVEMEHAVKIGGGPTERAYRKFVEMLRDAVYKMGTWSPIEAADVTQVMKTIIDPGCTAWRKRMKGIRTGNCRQILKQEDKKEQVLKAAEDREIPEEASAVLAEDSLKGKTPEQQREIRLTIKRYFSHVQKAHEEAACAAGKLVELADVLDKDEFYAVAQAGTRPLIALQLPDAMLLLDKKKEEVRKAELREEVKNMDIEEVIVIQNLPTSLERWKKSKVLMPTRLLAAATHYFIYSQAVQEAPMTNKAVTERFKVPVGSLHRITSGRHYAGGHASQKGQMGDHGEKTLKVARHKKGKVAIAKIPTMVTLTDVEGTTPAAGTRKRR